MFQFELQYKDGGTWQVWDSYFSYHAAELEASEFNHSATWRIKKVRVKYV